MKIIFRENVVYKVENKSEIAQVSENLTAGEKIGEVDGIIHDKLNAKNRVLKTSKGKFWPYSKFLYVFVYGF